MKIFNIPNIITLLNAATGFAGIVFALNGNWRLAFYMVIAAAIFDFLDGFAARALNQKTKIGPELDSLADAISFGVLPGVIMFQLLLNSINLPHIGFTVQDYFINPIIFIALIIPAFSILRLAKFNIDTEQSENFKGLATPANAFLIASFSVCMNVFCECNPLMDFFYSYQFLIAFSIITSLLLISNIPMFSLKVKSLKWSENKVRYIFLISSLFIFIFLIKYWFLAITIIIIDYILLSIIWKTILKKDF